MAFNLIKNMHYNKAIVLIGRGCTIIMEITIQCIIDSLSNNGGRGCGGENCGPWIPITPNSQDETNPEKQREEEDKSDE
jgi:hypothetical protein